MNANKYKLERLKAYLNIDVTLSDGEVANILSNQLMIIGDTKSIINSAYSKLDIESKFKSAKQDWRRSIKRGKNANKSIVPFSTKDIKWQKLRKDVFRKYGRVCLCCGSRDKIQVDHIKPKSIYPSLAYRFNNLQPLCGICNRKKSNMYETDYRIDEQQREFELAMAFEFM